MAMVHIPICCPRCRGNVTKNPLYSSQPFRTSGHPPGRSRRAEFATNEVPTARSVRVFVEFARVPVM